MTEVHISTKFQVVIPREVRTGLHLKPGQKISCLAKNGIIYLIPSRPLSEMRGFLKLKPGWMKNLREKKDRF